MSRRTFEDFPQGLTLEYGAYEVTREEIISFASQFDPQPFHLDEEAGRRSILGGLSASGWHTASIAMRLHCDNWLLDTAGLGSPGIPELRWMKPVRPGDVLRVRASVKSARLSQSRPGLGLVECAYTVLNQRDEELMIKRGMMMLATREGLDKLAARPLAPSPERALAHNAPLGVDDPASLPDDHGILTGFFEDVRIGHTIDAGKVHFDRESIIAFARAYDPQPMHTDSEAARAGPYGELIASGWHTGSACMRRLVETRARYGEEARRRGLVEAAKGPSPGFCDLKWLKPVMAGDTIRFCMTAAEKRRTSRKGWGLVFSEFGGFNQYGDKVYEYKSISFWPLREAS